MRCINGEIARGKLNENMEYKDYYAILDLDKKANQDEIKKAYRRLARKYHPDVSKEKNAEEQFKDVQEAYEVLKDPKKREAYDTLGSNWRGGQDFRPPPNWEGAQFHGSDGGQFSSEDMAGFSDFFSQMFGGGGRQGGFRRQHGFEDVKQRGGDQNAKIAISLSDAYHGSSRTFQLHMPDGKHTIKVNIPAGSTSGQKLRLTGQGGPGISGGPAGDLYLEIEVQPDSLYSLQGRDVYITLPVTPWEAALGAEIKVPTLGGAVGMKLAPGTHAGQRLRLKGRGLPGHSQGDQYAIVQLVAPAATTPEQKKLYEEMAAAMPFNPRKDWPV
jgi:curved DNA-binding protein